uniref:R3H domain-containing protein n=1 Tax=Panagrolaimus sp. ES5 TaxID=591445 RepID=A0AC34GV20_9BILA
MKPNGFGQRQLSEDSGNNRKKQLARSDATCIEEPPRPATAGRPPSVFSPSEAPWYTDKTGVNLIQFVRNTLHKNPKDREMMLSLEKDMRSFIQDVEKRALRFPKMSSYNRMLIHRAAAFFGLDHNIDNSASSVICTKTPKTRIPEIDFKSLIDGNIYTDHMLRNQYPRRSAQSFDECYTPSRGNRRQYRNAHSNSLDLTRRGNSIENESPFMPQPQMIHDGYGLPNANITYQTTPYSGPPICVPYVCKENPLQEYTIESQKSEDGTDPQNTSSTNTTTTGGTLDEPEQYHYLQPIYDPSYFMSLHSQASTHHATPGIPVGYIIYQDNNVKLVPQADVSNLANQFSSLQLNNTVGGIPQSPQTPSMPYSTSTPPNPYISPANNPRGIPYATLESGSYSTPPMNPGSNIAYVSSNPESPGIVYATQMPIGSCGMTYTSPPQSQDPSMAFPYPGYPNT